jgi:hypothetical protein
MISIACRSLAPCASNDALPTARIATDWSATVETVASSCIIFLISRAAIAQVQIGSYFAGVRAGMHACTSVSPRARVHAHGLD